MRALPSRVALVIAICGFAAATPLRAGDSTPSKEEMAEFLLKADVVRSRPIGKGVTRPYRLTLSDGRLTHDAAFQSVDERKTMMKFEKGNQEMNFVDSYKFNLAAYHLAGMLGLDDMMPVTVPRTWNGKRGAVSWWIDAKLDEGERMKKNLTPPDVNDWNQQMYRMRVFAKLVADTDRNLGNVLIAEEPPDEGSNGALRWKLWMIDFTRAFRLHKDVRNPGDLKMCDRRLFEKLQQLSTERVRETCENLLTNFEIDAMFERRDKIVAHFRQLITEQGENNVLYD